MKISGYTTTRNTVDMGYPFKEAIESLLDFCDEVVVADSSDKDDGTQEVLEELMEKHDKLKVVHVDVDYSAPNFPIWDGKMKAIARAQCTGDYCYQLDCDEIVPVGTRAKLEDIINKTIGKTDMPPVLCLPVVEYWGSQGKVRVDVNPWKWRISRNDPNLTHGIPKELRKIDPETGLLYALPGTDTCDYIWKDTKERAPSFHYITNDAEAVRQAALQGNEQALKVYQDWVCKTLDTLPYVHHFSWWSIKWKIENYKKFWNLFWKRMYNDTSKSEGWNPFFDGDIRQITDKQIELCAKALETCTGGHIFHSKWNYTFTPSIDTSSVTSIPERMSEWIESKR